MNRLVVALAACLLTGLSGARVAEAQSLPHGEVRFVCSAPDLTFLPMHLAAEMGFDRENGFSSTFTYAATPIAIKAMISGEFEFSMSAASNLAVAVQGAPVRMVAIHASKVLFTLYGKNAIQTLKQLEGKTVGVSSMGDSTQISGRAAMVAEGVNIDTVTFVALGQQNVPPALLGGTIDAAVIIPPRELMLEKSGKFHRLAFLGDYNAVPSMGLSTTVTMIEKRPDMIRAVVKTARRALEFVKTDKARTVAFMAKYLKLSPEDAETSWERLVPHLADDVAIGPEEQERIIDVQMEIVKPKVRPRADQVFDMSFTK